MDSAHISDIAKNRLSELEVCLVSTVEYFSSTPLPSLAKKKAKPKRKEVPSSLISSHPGTIGFGKGSPARSSSRGPKRPGPSTRSPSDSPVGSTSESSDSPPAKKKGWKTYKLHQCATFGKTWKKKSDLS